MTGRKPGRSWTKTFSHLDWGYQSSFDGSSLLLPFEQSLTDEAFDNAYYIFCPAFLASFLFAFPQSSPTSNSAALGQSGNNQLGGAPRGRGFVSIKRDKQAFDNAYYIFCPAFLASFLFAFPQSSPTSNSAALGQSGNNQLGGLRVAGALSPSKGTNKQLAAPNLARRILRKYCSQHPQALLPPQYKALDAKKCFAAVRQHLHV